jgi:PDZ domain-containing protein
VIDDVEMEPIVPPGPTEDPRGAPRIRWWAVLLTVVAGLLVLAVAVLAFVPVPYFAFAPGDAREVLPRITVTGAETFETDGTIDFVTVGVPRLAALGALLGVVDPNTDVVEEDRVLGGRTEEENREDNLQLMGYSKDFATYVALEHLGLPVSITGGGVVIDSLCMEQAADGSCALQAPADEVLDPGDMITAIDGQPVNLAADIGPALEGKEAGDVVSVTYVRPGSDDEQTGEVALTTADGGRVILGIIPNPSPPSTIAFDFPVEVTIDSGQVGGPSAGLAFTLALLETLTPGSLTGGKTVAATGTINPAGQVGNIGGLRQKTVAVERAGADLFLVPIDEEDVAKQAAAGTDLQVVGVADLDDALAALAAVGGNALEIAA